MLFIFEWNHRHVQRAALGLSAWPSEPIMERHFKNAQI